MDSFRHSKDVTWKKQMQRVVSWHIWCILFYIKLSRSTILNQSQFRWFTWSESENKETKSWISLLVTFWCLYNTLASPLQEPVSSSFPEDIKRTITKEVVKQHIIMKKRGFFIHFTPPLDSSAFFEVSSRVIDMSTRVSEEDEEALISRFSWRVTGKFRSLPQNRTTTSWC